MVVDTRMDPSSALPLELFSTITGPGLVRSELLESANASQASERDLLAACA